MVSKPWKGETVVCIASGPSLIKSDCDLVQARGLVSIAVNRSWEMASFVNVVYGGDMAFWDAYGIDIDIPAERVTCMRSAAKKHGITIHGPHGQVFNSGMRAIQFAMHRGSKNIILLGYDCDISEGTHWHGDHNKTKNPDARKVLKWHSHFGSVALEAKSKGVRIINCTRRTKLTCFEKLTLEKALLDASDDR